ncbi:glycoside hydrolase family 18 protein [Xylariaceae sp. FL1651]|nr:glycoside hydrolase family 18 protein [Xylariaceae sp. FL1651]
MRLSRSASAASILGIAVAAPRFAMYYDEWHTVLPSKNDTAGITHVITAFADPLIFTTDPPGNYSPSIEPGLLCPLFDEGTKMCLAIGGWGMNDGYTVGQKTEATRALFAKNVATTLHAHGYECVEIDWEYPGGNGADYRQTPNSDKTDEVDNYPLLLRAIKDAIGDKELSIAVPGLDRDFIAFTAEKVPQINEIVDVVNLMTYDLMNRRDNTTQHHTSVQGSLNAVERYIELGMNASKMNLGIAFYAKYFETIERCTEPIGCKTALLEYANGTDTYRSGATTFRDGVPVLKYGQADETEGGQWYWDPSTNYFWTWDTPEFIAQKFEKIVKAKGLGGVMAWSLGEDAAGYPYVQAMQAGLQTL